MKIDTVDIDHRANECQKGKCFEEEQYIGDGLFEAFIPFSITKDNLIIHGTQNKSYKVIIDTSSLSSYPIFAKRDKSEIQIDTIHPEAFEDTRNHFQAIENGELQHRIEFWVHYYKNIKELEDGSYITEYLRPQIGYSNPVHRQVERSIHSNLDLQKYSMRFSQNWAYAFVRNKNLTDKIRFIEETTQNFYSQLDKLSPMEKIIYKRLAGNIRYHINSKTEEKSLRASINEVDINTDDLSEIESTDGLFIDVVIDLDKAMNDVDFAEKQKVIFHTLKDYLHFSLQNLLQEKMKISFSNSSLTKANKGYLFASDALSLQMYRLMYALRLAAPNMGNVEFRIMDEDCFFDDYFYINIHNNKHMYLKFDICSPNAVLFNADKLEQAFLLSLSPKNHIRLNGYAAYKKYEYLRSKGRMSNSRPKIEQYYKKSYTQQFGFQEFWHTWKEVRNMSLLEIVSDVL